MREREHRRTDLPFRHNQTALVVSQIETAGKKSMDFFDWRGARRPHSELCNDEQRS